MAPPKSWLHGSHLLTEMVGGPNGLVRRSSRCSNMGLHGGLPQYSFRLDFPSLWLLHRVLLVLGSFRLSGLPLCKGNRCWLRDECVPFFVFRCSRFHRSVLVFGFLYLPGQEAHYIQNLEVMSWVTLELQTLEVRYAFWA